MRDADNKWRYLGLDFPATPLNEWVNLTVEFTAPPTLHEANVYLYSMHSKETVDYDNLWVRMLP
jgi:hypothetical protein